MYGWEFDKAKTDKLRPQVAAILGQYFYRPAPIEEDQARNTDYLWYGSPKDRIAVRIRDSNRLIKIFGKASLKKWLEQFTIRLSRPSGRETELHKILNGWGSHLLYGFADYENNSLYHWAFADLSIFRQWYSPKHRHRMISNYDGSSKFVPFDWEELPAEFILCTSWQKEGEQPSLITPREPIKPHCQPTLL